MKKVILLFILTCMFAFTSCKDPYQSASKQQRMEMAEKIPADQLNALNEILFTKATIDEKGFKLNATKEDFKNKGIDLYYYYAAKDSIEETYKKLTSGSFSVSGLDGMNMLKAYIETFNAQKAAFLEGRPFTGFNPLKDSPAF